MKKETGSIYRIFHRVSNRSYVGLTCLEVPVRVLQHCTSQSPRGIALAIRREGTDAFLYEVLESDVPVSRLRERERYYVAQFGSMAPAGYNVQRVGNPVSEVFRDGIINDVSLSAAEAGSRLGLSGVRVFQLRQARGLQAACQAVRQRQRQERQLGQDAHRDSVINDASLSHQEAGSRLGLSAERVRQLRAEQGIRTEAQRGREARDEQVLRLYQEGLSQRAIAKETGVPLSTVRRILKSAQF